MHGFADAWVVLLQAHKSELLRATRQVAEKQSVFEGKQAESSKLGDCLTANVEEVAALRQGMAGAAQVRSAAAQVSNVLASCLADVLQLHMVHTAALLLAQVFDVAL